MTPLDSAHAAMEAAPEDAEARLAFYEAFATSELSLLLKDDAPGDDIRPALFDTGDGTLALVFDGEDRLSAFAGGPAPYAALPGRALAQMLAGKGIGLALNFPDGPAAFLMPPDAVDWLAATLSQAPTPTEARPDWLGPPALPERLLAALDRRLARATGLAAYAYLAAARWPGGRESHLVALIDPAPGAEEALAQAIGEALTFSGLEAQGLDIAFPAANDPLTRRLARTALRFDLPEPEKPSAPGMDPKRPPRLR